MLEIKEKLIDNKRRAFSDYLSGRIGLKRYLKEIASVDKSLAELSNLSNKFSAMNKVKNRVSSLVIAFLKRVAKKIWRCEGCGPFKSSSCKI